MENNDLKFADLLAIFSIYLGIRNLTENEQQSDQQLAILRQNNISSANDKQAAYLLTELDRKFEEIKKMLEEILQAVKK